MMQCRNERRWAGIRTWRRMAVVMLGATVVVAASACEDSTGPDATTQEQVAYIDGIVPHHQIAIMRADEAVAKATEPGLRTLAQRVNSPCPEGRGFRRRGECRAD